VAPTPRFLTAGERVLVAEYGDGIDERVNTHVHLVARALARTAPAGLVEVVPTYRSVALWFDPLVTSVECLEEAIRGIDAHIDAGETLPSRVVEVPVVYGGAHGPDLADVAAHTGLSEAEVVALHAAGSYRVYMMGFTPGFPYLGGMSPRLATPRLATPRTSVPAGSVGIAAQQTGIYPAASPGGWRLIGRSPLRLFHPALDPPALLGPGDTVRFVPADTAGFASTPQHAPAPAPAPREDGIEVLDGGLLTTVQDLGRYGYQRYGVPVAGAMDVRALREANALVGNDGTEAGLEMTLVGPALRFDAEAAIAMTGGDLGPRLNGRPVPLGRPLPVCRGDTLTCDGRRHGLRMYLAAAGGIDVPPVLGSRSTYLASGFGGYEGRALRAGDRLPLPGGARRTVNRSLTAPRRPPAEPGGSVVIRVVLGPQDDAFTPEGLDTFLSAVYELSAASDRLGCRMTGPRIAHRRGADIVSDATAFGSVQVSGDGQPIVLMADRGTTGGYTKIATVISADLSLLAQASPGDRVRFGAVDRAAAVAALREAEAAIAAIRQAADAGPAGAAGEDIYDEDHGAAFAAEGVDDFARALDARTGGERASSAAVLAGMTGLVVAVMVAPGDEVTERQTLLVVEAMKMQNPVRAPRAGRVARVPVAAGAPVSSGTVVVEFEG
jgi:KipI family sensor histidine kinase inhibitor